MHGYYLLILTQCFSHSLLFPFYTKSLSNIHATSFLVQGRYLLELTWLQGCVVKYMKFPHRSKTTCTNYRLLHIAEVMI
ncbi:hypothetical protein F5Y13DRAFT_165082 [Hypoxylon sp. FL1857]|nr:hypothetical protein F5Y13DRAFT_165082 [Hypoxylon sp. FL1857]